MTLVSLMLPHPCHIPWDACFNTQLYAMNFFFFLVSQHVYSWTLATSSSYLEWGGAWRGGMKLSSNVIWRDFYLEKLFDTADLCLLITHFPWCPTTNCHVFIHISISIQNTGSKKTIVSHLALVMSNCDSISGRSLGENRRTTCNKKIGSNIFIIGKFCKKFTCKIGDFKIVKHVYM
jgi:hypothetical protein